jgi:hypothetical protein
MGWSSSRFAIKGSRLFCRKNIDIIALNSIECMCDCCVQVELVEEGPPRRLKVEYKSTETGQVASDEYNTVGSAIVMVSWMM